MHFSYTALANKETKKPYAQLADETSKSSLLILFDKFP